MAQITFSIRMEENLKRDFDNLCKELGLTATTAFNVFAKAMVRDREIPFKISAKPKNPDNLGKIIVSQEGFNKFLEDCLNGSANIELSKKDLIALKEIKNIKVVE